MSNDFPLQTGAVQMPPSADGMAAVMPAQVTEADRKGLDLAVIKKGAKDYLDFLDTTKEVFYAYLYHRTGSTKLAQTMLTEIYLDVLSSAMSFFWFGTLSFKLIFDAADHALEGKTGTEADIDNVYVPSLAWLSEEEKHSVSGMHDALWTLPREAQRLLILSLLVGLSTDRIASGLLVDEQIVKDQLVTAKELFIKRWQPAAGVSSKLDALVFVPSLDIAAETTMRFSVVEKYNALRFRKYQWVIIGGLFAVLSNVIVASVLAFAVIVQPPTSLRGMRTEVASLDALVIMRQEQAAAARRSISASLEESKHIAAYGSARNITSLGLSTAIDALGEQQKDEANAKKLIKLLERARTAMKPALQVAMRDAPVLLAMRAVLPL